ncbi:MAG: Phosphate regulon sensor protein PhoR (SphS) [uncultured Thermomicrobiales bacterium]|uniref:histidine kinase n=1 Tax=uncultured Thermomicrobiales bacterium TaxID=1645740 RepID=A0A6J4VMU8_9BACT|nr:MAG: Phosphate regulon sensor protein PhoR (SphS) [uncultured Thermomicrobiales bacterium]
MSRTIGLRSRLLLTTVPLVLVATTLLALYLIQIARELYVTGAETQLLGQSRLVAGTAAGSWEDRAALDDLAKELSPLAGNRITIIARDGTVLGDSAVDPATMDNHADRPEVRAVLTDQRGLSVRYSTSVGREFIYAAVPIVRDATVVGVARVAQPLDRVNAQIARLRLVALIGVAFSGVLAAALAGLLSRYIIQPINNLTAVTSGMAAGDLDRRADPRGTDEIGRLGLTFNRMADELRETIGIISDERAKLAAILETMGDGLLMIDHDGEIVLANSAAERLMTPVIRPQRARPRREARGRALIEVAHDHELPRLVREARQRGQVSSMLLELSGGRRTIRAVAAPVRGVAGGPVLLVLQDLTEVRRLETARRDFVANISHELRTPLASLKALVETLDGGAIEDDEAARHFLSLMNGEVDHLTQLVRELLELSRIESGQVPLDRAPIAPCDLIELAVARLATQAERANLDLTVEDCDNLPPVLADRERVSQIFLNLLHNAIKFTPAGGRIAVGAECQGGAVAFHVCDSGTGVDPDDLPRIFERFYKADKARSGGGTGLGLAIAKHLVGAHGGILSAQNNTDGPGATFTFTLPLVTEGGGEQGKE